MSLEFRYSLHTLLQREREGESSLSRCMFQSSICGIQFIYIKNNWKLIRYVKYINGYYN